MSQYIHIDHENNAFLITEKVKTQYYQNGLIWYNHEYPIGSMVPFRTNEIDKMENLGKAYMSEVSMKIRELLEHGVKIR